MLPSHFMSVLLERERPDLLNWHGFWLVELGYEVEAMSKRYIGNIVHSLLWVQKCTLTPFTIMKKEVKLTYLFKKGNARYTKRWENQSKLVLYFYSNPQERVCLTTKCDIFCWPSRAPSSDDILELLLTRVMCWSLGFVLFIEQTVLILIHLYLPRGSFQMKIIGDFWKRGTTFELLVHIKSLQLPRTSNKSQNQEQQLHPLQSPIHGRCGDEKASCHCTKYKASKQACCLGFIYLHGGDTNRRNSPRCWEMHLWHVERSRVIGVDTEGWDCEHRESSADKVGGRVTGNRRVVRYTETAKGEHYFIL